MKPIAMTIINPLKEIGARDRTSDLLLTSPVSDRLIYIGLHRVG